MIIQCPQCQSRYNATGENTQKPIQCRCGVTIFIPKLANIAKAWHCSNCGASVDPNKASCDYCHAYLAFARCPACFGIAPYKGARFCSECGESLTLPVKPIQHKNAQLPCPRCDSTLKSKLVDKHLVEVCHDCGGAWISHKLFDELLQNEPLDSTSVLGKPVTKYPRLKLYEIRYLPCPECNKSMNRYNFMGRSNIILDECSEHGVWFDKHELAASLNFMRSYQNAASKTPGQKPSVDVAEDEETASDVTYPAAQPIEIKEEDLSLLLKEFPKLFSSKNTG
jgi:Zn-finger nucleic acid-binding protein